ncbi:MAG: hypothetical protein WAV20_01765 [Blastocatellia bacterium]
MSLYVKRYVSVAGGLRQEMVRNSNTEGLNEARGGVRREEVVPKTEPIGESLPNMF